MGDLDSNISLASSASSKTKSCENLPSDLENTNDVRDPASGTGTATGTCSGAPGAMAARDDPHVQLSGAQMDAILLQLEQGVEVALHRAKLWSKYAKDIMTYVEKRCHLEMEMARNVAKLALTVRSALKEEVGLFFIFIFIFFNFFNFFVSIFVLFFIFFIFLFYLNLIFFFFFIN